MIGTPNPFNVSGSKLNLNLNSGSPFVPANSNPAMGGDILPGPGLKGGWGGITGVIVLIVAGALLLHLLRDGRDIEDLVVNWLYVALTATAGVSLYKVIFLRWNIPFFTEVAHFV